MHNSNKRNAPHAALLLSLSAMLGCNAQEPALVGSNAQSLTIDKVDILLVVDDSASMADFKQEELPRLLDALVSGSAPEFAAIENVHVAVTSTNLGADEELWNPGAAQPAGPTMDGSEPMAHGAVGQCEGRGDDGVFIPLEGQDLAQCEAQYPTYVSLDHGNAELATSQTVACLPSLTALGCGYEQPLEATLKALWPATDGSVEFLYGEGHGAGANAGFLRDDSLLIVVVITDEDDCSAEDPRLFQPENLLASDDPLVAQSVNTRCGRNPELLFDRARYVDGLSQLRPDNDNVLFVTLAGIPPEMVGEEAQAAVNFGDAAERDAYYDAILAAPAMQETIVNGESDPRMAYFAASCMKSDGNGARPPRRLVQVAKDFGERGVVGSLCGDDFGPVVGRIIRAAAERID